MGPSGDGIVVWPAFAFTLRCSGEKFSDGSTECTWTQKSQRQTLKALRQVVHHRHPRPIQQAMTKSGPTERWSRSHACEVWFCWSWLGARVALALAGRCSTLRSARTIAASQSHFVCPRMRRAAVGRTCRRQNKRRQMSCVVLSSTFETVVCLSQISVGVGLGSQGHRDCQSVSHQYRKSLSRC